LQWKFPSRRCLPLDLPSRRASARKLETLMWPLRRSTRGESRRSLEPRQDASAWRVAAWQWLMLGMADLFVHQVAETVLLCV
jgi:hypothetical protein